MLEVLSAWQTVALIRMPLSSLLLLQSNLIWMQGRVVTLSDLSAVTAAFEQVLQVNLI